MDRHNKTYSPIIAIIFLFYTSAIVFFNILVPDKMFSESENRKLQTLPYFSLHKLLNGKFTGNYEKYIADQFVFRDFWIGIQSDTEKAIGKKENNGVYIGKDGYLIQAFHKPSDEDFQRKIEAINSFSASNPNTNKYFMLVPNAVKVLEEKLPPYALCEDQLIYMDKIKKSIDSSIKFIDIYDVLYAKKDAYIFYKTDHHWTTKGAYYAYKESGKIMGFMPQDIDDFKIKKATDKFYGSLYSKSGFRHLSPDYIELYMPKKDENMKIMYFDENKISPSPYHMNNLYKKDKYTVFFDGNHPLMKITSNRHNKKRLLVLKDSYANCFIPFLMPHYSEIYVVDLRYYNDNVSNLIKKNHINNILFLYNENTFFEDSAINKLNFQ